MTYDAVLTVAEKLKFLGSKGYCRSEALKSIGNLTKSMVSPRVDDDLFRDSRICSNTQHRLLRHSEPGADSARSQWEISD